MIMIITSKEIPMNKYKQIRKCKYKSMDIEYYTSINDYIIL